MYRYLFILFIAVMPLYGQLIDELPGQESNSMEPPETFVGESHIVLADESDEPDSGNWYEKLRWWKEAKWLYTIDIRNAIDQLEVLDEEYDLRKKTILSALDQYSASLPLKRQAAVHVIDGLLDDLLKRQEEIAQEQTRTQARKDQEESTELEEHQKLLGKLKSDFNDFNTMTQRLKQTFDVVVPKQVQAAQAFDMKALEAYESIEGTLDDKKAHKSFDEVENALENINALMAYLKGPLWIFIDKAWAKMQQIMPTITDRISELEDMGVVVRPLTAQEKTQMAQLEKERKERRARKAAERKASKERMARSWWKKVFSGIGSFFVRIGSGIWYGVTRPFVWIGNLFSQAEPARKLPTKKAPAKKAPAKKTADQPPSKPPTKTTIPPGMKPPALIPGTPTGGGLSIPQAPALKK